MKKRIAIVVGIPNFDYSNEKSAVAAFLRTIKTAFEQAGCEVQLGFESKSTVIHSEDANAAKGIKQKLKSILKIWKWGYQSLAFRSFFKRQDQLIENYKSIKPADLVVEFHTVGSTLGLKLAKKWNCKFSVIFDSPVDQQFLEMYKTKTLFWSRIQNSERLTMQAADKIMAYSPACKDYLKSKYSIHAKIEVLPCIVDKPVVQNNPDPERFKIGFIGSFLSWHKVEDLVRAFYLFRKEIPESKLELIGFGEEWNSVKDLVQNLELTAFVEMPGFVSEEKLKNYKRNFSVAIMPGSNWYGSPLKLFEYAASGIPFIAPNTTTVSSVFTDQADCLMVDENNRIQSIYQHLIYLVQNPEKAKQLGGSAQAYYLANYASNHYLLNLYKTLNNEV